MANTHNKLAEIVDKNDALETLKVLRRKLAATIDESNSGRDIAALSRQLREVTKQITEVEEAEKYRAASQEIDRLISSEGGVGKVR